MQHRPLPQGHENVNYFDHLELRYLRWDYLVKVANPSDKVLKSKEKIIKYIARSAFSKYAYEFSFMGMDLEDVENIARVYAVSFLGLYSHQHSTKIRQRHTQKFIQKYGQNPSEEDLEKKDSYALMSFLEQRLLECSNVLRQKSKPEPGFSSYNAYVQVSGDQWPSDDELIASPSKYGWRKVAWGKFIKARKNFGAISPGYAVFIDGKIYRVASPDNSVIHSDPAIGPIYDSLERSPMNPEELMISLQEADTKKVSVGGVGFNVSKKERLSNLVDLYKRRPAHIQKRIMKRAINWLSKRNGFQKEMAEEISMATSILNSLNRKTENENVANR